MPQRKGKDPVCPVPPSVGSGRLEGVGEDIHHLLFYVSKSETWEYISDSKKLNENKEKQ